MPCSHSTICHEVFHENKQRSCPRCPKEWSELDSYPLFWAETKPTALYNALIKNHCIACVFDLCGSTSLMESCLQQNVKYVGLALNQTHATWLEKIADKMAARCCAQQDHPLYQSDLAETLQEMFPEALATKEDDAEPNPCTPVE